MRPAHANSGKGWGWSVRCAVFLAPLTGGLASADVFYYRDAEGIYHFTNVPGPDRAPFRVERPFPHGELSDSLTARGPIDPTSYDGIINEYAERYDVEAALVKAVIRAESGFDRHAVSRKGARGLMQLMPRTARNHGVMNVYDARENIKGGVKHLRMLLKRYGNNLPRVLAAYNAGSQPVERYHGIPPYEETRTYVARVLRFRQQYLKQQRLAQLTASSRF